MADMSAIQESFFQECDDLLEALFEGLSAMEGGDTDSETVNAVFRAVHSIKGGAGAFNLTDLVSFAHTFETVLDQVRSNQRDADAELMNLMLRSADQLASLVEAAQGASEINEEARDAVLGELETLLGDSAEEEEVVFAPMTLDFGSLDGPLVPPDRTVEVRFKPHARLYTNGHEPAFLFASLADQGQLEVEVDISAVPPLDSYDHAEAYLDWTLRFSALNPEAAVEEVFEFVEGLCDLTVTELAGDLPPLPDLPDLPDLGGDMAEGPAPLDFGPAEEAAEAPAPVPTQTEPDASAPLAAAAADLSDDTASGGGDKWGDGKSKKTATATAAAKPTLRVDLDRVDRLINTVGELIINQAVLTQRLSNVTGADASDIEADLDEYKILARDLQEGVMAIRAQPVKSLFQRMSRIVREASAATGKTARLNLRGEGTEVDKTVIERLADPLTHMIRNAIDHGLETADVRVAAGKPPEGNVHLSASHRSGNVLIEIADDGAGLNRPKIRDIAVKKGLIPASAELSDAEIDQLLFMPGFSTADQVSNLSGRGVGMDVVKNAIQALGGRVSISSVPGQGTTFSIVLPLTLAVMDGMVVSVADETMVVPITPILETIRPTEDDIEHFGAEAKLLSIRGRHVPIVDVAQCLSLGRKDGKRGGDILILVETDDAGQCALAVDGIHDQRQVVIKSVAGDYGEIPGVSAATILGNGSIALILDVDYLIRAKSNGLEPAKDMALEMEI